MALWCARIPYKGKVTIFPSLQFDLDSSLAPSLRVTRQPLSEPSSRACSRSRRRFDLRRENSLLHLVSPLLAQLRSSEISVVEKLHARPSFRRKSWSRSASRSPSRPC